MSDRYPFVSVDRRSFFAIVLVVLTCFAGLVPGLSAQATAHFAFAQTASFNVTLPKALTVDLNGNLYIVADKSIVKKPWTGSGYGADVLVASADGLNGVAVDGSGTVFITNASNPPWVSKATWNSGTNQYDVNALPFSGNTHYPEAIAVDDAGNLYIADTQANRIIMEQPNVSGGYNEFVLFTSTDGLNHPSGVAVDRNGNVYIVQPSVNQVFMEALTPGSDRTNPANYTKSMIGSNLGTPWSVAVDSSGNIYIADYRTDPTPGTPTWGRILEETPSPGGGYTQTVIAGSDDSNNNIFLSNPEGVAVDASGNLYVSNTNWGQVYKWAIAGVDFGSVNVGATSAKISLIFRFDSAGTISAPAVLTMGSSTLDFRDAGTGTCNRDYSYQYAAGSICRVDVLFSPKHAGARNGGASLSDSNGATIATGYVYGTGVGPEIAFSPGTQSVAASTLTGVQKVVVDGSGNIFTNGGAYVLMNGSTQIGSFAQAGAMAVDGSGNLYVLDLGSTPFKLQKETRQSNGSYVQTLITSKDYTPRAVAVDGSGNIYFTHGYGYVWKETLNSNGTYIESRLPIETIAEPGGIAVDSSGNLYIADYYNHKVLKETPSRSGYTETVVANQSSSPLPVDGPTDVVVDGLGNVYILDYYHARVVKEAPAGGSYVQSLIADDSAPYGLNNPMGIALDGASNVYIADNNLSQVLKEDSGAPPSLNFATTNVGSTSGPQTVTVWNNGNATLTFPLPTSPDLTVTNPSVPANFSWNDASTCDRTNSGSGAAYTLAALNSCTVAINFEPTSSGNLSGNVVLTDDNLNASPSATQLIPLAGTGALVDQAPSITSASSVTFIANSSHSFTVQATGSPTPTFSETGALPTGVNFDSAGHLSGTAASGTGGVYPITFTATNSLGTDTQNFTLTVHEAPAITSANSTTFTVGAAGNFTVTATGYPAAMTFSETGPLPSGVTLSPAGILSGTPAAGTAGSYPISIKASNGVGTDAAQSFTLTVLAASLVSIAVTPANASVAAGLTQPFTATGTYSDASTQDFTSSVTWSSSRTTYATITSGGVATGVARGRVTITATQGTIIGTAILTVTAAVVQSIDVTPATATINNGQTQSFVAMGHLSDGSTQTITRTVAWSSSDPTVATISNGGLARGVGHGIVTITATMGSISQSATLTVNRTLVSITIAPSNPTVKVGAQQQFIATGNYSDQSTADLTATATWSSSSTSVATIDASGLATGVSIGKTKIKATSGAISGTTTLSVTR